MKFTVLALLFCLLCGCSSAEKPSQEQLKLANESELVLLKEQFTELQNYAADPSKFIPDTSKGEPAEFERKLNEVNSNLEGYLNKYGEPKELLTQIQTSLQAVNKMERKTTTVELKRKLDEIKALADKLPAGSASAAK